MIVDVILGNTVDTKEWIAELRALKCDCIIVLDYDYYGPPIKKDNIVYINTYDIKHYIEEYDSVNYYKSLYGYPGMNGNMASLYKKK